jgi:hypothetical protein
MRALAMFDLDIVREVLRTFLMAEMEIFYSSLLKAGYAHLYTT